jgi:hypothetical protein
MRRYLVQARGWDAVWIFASSLIAAAEAYASTRPGLPADATIQAREE